MRIKLLVSKMFMKRIEKIVVEKTDEELQKEYELIITRQSSLCSAQRTYVVNEMNKRGLI